MLKTSVGPLLIRILALCVVAAWLLPAAAQPPAAGPGAEAPAEAGAGTDEDVETLIRLLENDEARAALIERLRAAEAATDAGPATVAPEETLAGALAAYTRDIAEGAVGLFGAITNLVDEVGAVLTGAVDVDLDALQRVVLGVAVVVAATFGVYLFLRLVFAWVQRRLAASAENADLVRRIKMTGVSTLLDIATVLLAWGAGYVAALYAGESRQVGIDQSLFLNAFLIIELTKAVSRVLLAPRWPTLRFVPIDDTTAAYWYFWLSRLFSLVGYAFLFVAPLLATGVSTRVSEAVRILVLFAALAILIAIVLQNRDNVRARLMRRAADSSSGTYSRSLAVFGRVWHIAAIGYLIAVYGLWLADPETALPFVLRATGQSVLAIAIGFALSGLISRFASGGMRLPPDVKERLPLLEARLNAFVPNVLRVVRMIVAVAVIITVAQTWRLIDFSGWMANDAGRRVVASLVSASLILLVGGVLYLAVQSWIEYRLSPSYGHPASARERTLLGLFRNAFTIVLVVVVLMLVLSELGVNIGPLLAGAGVVGLAVGFGAQKLVQDVINGAFIQFENTMNEGDVVTAGGVTGVVERLTIRSVSLRSLDGTYHVIPFSSVDTVSNAMKIFSYHIAAIGVAYRENILEVKEAMEEAFERLKQTPSGVDIIGDFEMHGVTEFADSAVIVRARIKTLPGQQWALGRVYNELVKQVFDERGIEIPFPHVTLYMGEDKAGNAPPLRIRSAETTDAQNAVEVAADDGAKPAASQRIASTGNLGEAAG